MVFDEEKWRKLVFYGNSCLGISSLCHDNQHVIMIDYDALNFEDATRDVQKLQKKFRLSDALLCQTIHGFHCYILDKFPYAKICEIIKESEADPWFKSAECRQKMGMVILRISSRGGSPPPVFKAIIPSRWSGIHVQSLAHWAFLRWFYGAPLKYPVYNDGSDKILVYLYKTLRN
jgi:hypothetical protein